jgi:hypothetical protein
MLTERDFFTGLGFWTRANPEPCLLATCGDPKRRAGDMPKLLLAPRREHSRKPDEAYERIERLLPSPGSQRRPPRSPRTGSLSGAVRPPEPAGLGQLQQSAWPVRSRPGHHPPPPLT